MGKILVLAEKPSVARDYAEVLNCKERKDGYIEGEKYIVTWCVGHLFTLFEPEDYKPELKQWKLETLPIVPERFNIKPIEATKKQFKVIEGLIKRPDVTEIINGGDAGREGELIQRYVLRAAGNKKPVKRLWISSLTAEDIKNGFNKLLPSSEFDNLFKSAETRNQVDWLIGMNFTRAYTKLLGQNTVLSVGRCQTPILNLIVNRDIEIDNFKSVTYYEIESLFSKGYRGILRFDPKLTLVDKANEILRTVKGKLGTVKEIKSEEKKELPPQFFNLTNLQRRMNRLYKYSAKETLDIAQKLYEERKILSYPRSSSRHITKTLFAELPKHFESINFGKFAELIKNIDTGMQLSNRFVDDGKITDHHAIIPTANRKTSQIYDELTEKERNLFDEVIFSLIKAYYPDHSYRQVEVTTEVENYNFISKGKTILVSGWKTIDKEEESANDEEILQIPELKQGESVKVDNAEMKVKKTQPPKRITEDVLLAFLESHNIGTEATRANFIETLLQRKFIEKNKNNLLSTPFGRSFISNIKQEFIKDIETTRTLEEKLSQIEDGKLTQEAILKELINDLKKYIQELKGETFTALEIENLGICPKCKKGKVLEKEKVYKCDNKECDFFISKVICNGKIGKRDIKKLLEGKPTGAIKFKSKDNKDFESCLVWKDGKLNFVKNTKK
jgi:DNA topoisomerase-3